MKTKSKLLFEICLTGAFALIADITFCRCNLVAYPVPQRTKIIDNTKIEEEVVEIIEEPEPEPEPEKELTLLVYMAADNDLESHALRNLKEMEHACFDNMNVLVLLDRCDAYDETNDNWTDTRLFEVLHDDTNGSTIVSKRLDCPPLGLTSSINTELDTGDYNVLKDFIEFAVTNYETDKYALILWGHGTGWRYSLPEAARAVAIDDKSNSYICVKNLGLALEDFYFSAIGFDTCFGSVFENLYELKESSQFITASPGITPARGWNYKKLLEKLGKSDFSSQTIAESMAESSLAQMSIIETATLPSLMNALEDFSEQLAATITTEKRRHDTLEILLNTKAYIYTEYPCDMYLDISAMAENYLSNKNSELAQAALVLKEACRNQNIGLLLIPKINSFTLASGHSAAYIKNQDNLTQCSFIQENRWWVPTKNGNSGSVLDKLFYTAF